MNKFVIASAMFLLAATNMAARKNVDITVDPSKVENRVSPLLYGFLLEHIYHSASNGLWGENIWNRSFEEHFADGKWTVSSEGEVSLDDSSGEMSTFNIGKAKDFVLTFDVKRISGDGTILVGVRNQQREEMLTNRVFLYLGQRANSRHSLEASTGWIWHTPRVQTKTIHSEDGAISPLGWTKVKIVCDGNHITSMIGDKLFYDGTIENCPCDGNITIGGENCKVAFRNINVTTLNGTSSSVFISPFRHWSLIGKGSMSIDTDNPLNDKSSLHLVSTSRQAGIKQEANFIVLKNDPLVESIYLKGNIPSVSVRLVDKKKHILASAYISGIKEEWTEYPVKLISSKDEPEADIEIMAMGKGILDIDQFCMMNQSSADNGGYRPDLANAVAGIKPTAMRWPGGSFSELYQFEKGIGPQKDRMGKLRWDDFDPLSFGTDEFLRFCEQIGAEPQIVVPIGYHNYAGYSPDKNGRQDWLQRALDWMDYCNADSDNNKWGKLRSENGHPEPYNVKFWEIDNEVWKMDPKLYSQLVRMFSIAMKGRYPDVKIIGCGCGRLGKEGAGLDSIMIKDIAPYIDYISPHYYQTMDKYANNGVEEYGKYLDKLADWIALSDNPGMKIFLSEWNLDGIDMRTGLFAGGFLNRLERTPSVEMAAPALFLRHTSAPGWNNAFINFDKYGWFPAPNYIVMQLWRDNFQPNVVSFTGNVGDLNINSTTSDDRKTTCVKIVNPTEQEYSLTIKEGTILGTPVFETVYRDLTSRNTMTEPDKIKVEEGVFKVVANDVVLNIEPYSASVIKLIKQ